MATISELNVRLGLITRDFDRNLRRVERDLRSSGARLSRLGSDLTVAISAPLGAFGVASIKAAGDTEALTLALEGQIGSAEAARKEYELLRKEALKPGLGLEQALRGSVALQAVGLSAEKSRKTLSLFGNALALAGKGKAELDGVVLALTQISAKGKISAEEINQLAERLPQIRTLMKQAFGTADTEVLQKLGISAGDFIDKINAELEKLPPAAGGIKNSLENVGDAITQFLAGIGNEINKTFNLKKVGEDIADALGEALRWFQSLDDGTKKMIVQFGLFAVAAGPVIKILGVMQSTVAQGVGLVRSFAGGMKNLAGGVLSAASTFQKLDLVTKATVIGAVVTSVVALYVAFQTLSTKMAQASAAARVVEQVNLDASKAIADEKVKTDLLITTIESETSSRQDKAAALKKLQQIAPQYFGQLREENGIIVGLKAAYDNYIDSLLRSAKVAAAREQLVEIEKRLLDITKEQENAAKVADKSFSAAIKTGSILSAIPVAVGLVKTAEKSDLADEQNSLIQQRKALAGLIVETEKASIASNKLGNEIKDLGDNADGTYDKTKNLGNSIGGLSDGLSKKMRKALATVTANLDAFDQKLQLYGPSAEDAGKRNILLAASIDRLLKAGFSATSEQVRRLKDELAANTSVSEEARKAAAALNGEYFRIGFTLKESAAQAAAFDAATNSASATLSGDMRSALETVNAGIQAFNEQLGAQGDAAETAVGKNKILADSIQTLLNAGFSETSDQVRQLQSALDGSASATDQAGQSADALGNAYHRISIVLGDAAGSARQLAAATGNAGAALSDRMRAALADVNDSLQAFDEKLQSSGPTADVAVQKNLLLAASIAKLQEAGFSETSNQVQQLRDELDKTTSITDDARQAYEKLRAEWSKPVNIQAPPPPAIPTIPGADPLGVGQSIGNAVQGQGGESTGIVPSAGAIAAATSAMDSLTMSVQNFTLSGMTPAIEIMKSLENGTITFTEAFNKMAEDINRNGTVTQQIMLGLGQAFQEASSSGASSFADFAREFVRSAAKIIRTQIQIAVTNAALSALQSTPYPYNLILAGIAGAAAGALFQALVNKITAPKLAGGGVITGPTLALLGEYPGAGSNPEIAAPESKLRSIFRSESGGRMVQVYGTIRGDDIFISNRKAGDRNNRIR